METIQNDSYAERIYAHMENTKYVHKTEHISEQNEKTSDSLLLSLMGLNKPKNHFTLLANRNCKSFRGKNRHFIASEEVTGGFSQ